MGYFYNDYLAHHGILGMKWGIRRYQNSDGSLTDAGKKRYSRNEEKAAKYTEKAAKLEKKSAKLALKAARKMKHPITALSPERAKSLQLKSAKKRVKSDKLEEKAKKLLEENAEFDRKMKEIEESDYEQTKNEIIPFLQKKLDNAIEVDKQVDEDYKNGKITKDQWVEDKDYSSNEVDSWKYSLEDHQKYVNDYEKKKKNNEQDKKMRDEIFDELDDDGTLEKASVKAWKNTVEYVKKNEPALLKTLQDYDPDPAMWEDNHDFRKLYEGFESEEWDNAVNEELEKRKKNT